MRGPRRPQSSRPRGLAHRENSKEQMKRMRSFRSDEQRRSLVNQIKVMGSRQLDPVDLHRQAVKEAADLAHVSRPTLSKSTAVLYDGVYRVRCSHKPRDLLDVSRNSGSFSGARRALGRYGSSPSTGYTTADPRGPRKSMHVQTKLDLIMRNGRKHEDARDDELSQSMM